MRLYTVQKELQKLETNDFEIIKNFISYGIPGILDDNLIKFKDPNLFGSKKPYNAYTLLLMNGIIVDRDHAHVFDFPVEDYHEKIVEELNSESFKLSERSVKNLFINCEIDRLGIFVNDRIYNTIHWALENMPLVELDRIWRFPCESN